MRIKSFFAACVVALLALPALASAHVEVAPDTLPADSDVRMDFRVPNEEENAATDEVQVQMPGGFAEASYEPVPGWKVSIESEKVSQPLETDEGSVNEQVKTITWTATDPSAAIQPGQFRDFGIAAGMPSSAEEGDVLTFPAIQHYDNGDVVRWIGAPDSEHPAPHVTVTAAEPEAGAAPSAGGGDSETTGDDDNGAPTWLVVVAVALGAIGVVLGAAALGRARKSS